MQKCTKPNLSSGCTTYHVKVAYNTLRPLAVFNGPTFQRNEGKGAIGINEIEYRKIGRGQNRG